MPDKNHAERRPTASGPGGRPVTSNPKPGLIRIMHQSMQFSDSTRQKKRDAKRLFRRARKTNALFVTGTEASGSAGPLRELLKQAAARNGYAFYCPANQDSWVAVQKSDVDSIAFFYLEGFKGKAKQHSAKGIPGVRVEHKVFGSLVQTAGHYLTHGRPSGPRHKQARLEQNRILAGLIGDVAQAYRGKARVFYNGDQNINDRHDDTFLGEPLTSAADELKKYRATGHGPIDVIAQSDYNKNCKAVMFRVHNDRSFFMNTDHFLLEADYRLR